MENAVVVIPAFNPDEKLLCLIRKLRESGLNRILVIDDGSRADCCPLFEEAELLSCEVIHHAVNQGKGRALKTGYQHLLDKYGPHVFAVFADADGQHAVKDIHAVLQKLSEKPDCLVMGCRRFEDKQIPLRSRFGNKLTRFVFKLLCGVKVSDTQTGLRGLSGKTMAKFLSTKGERFEFEMNMLIEAREKSVELAEVEIETIYIEENQTSHFNPLRDSLRIYAVFAKFLVSSSLCFLVDILLFTLLVSWLDNFWDKSAAILTATLGARIVSSLLNYTINKRRVFGITEKRTVIIVRYYILCIIQLVCSGLLVDLLYALFPIVEAVIKTAVDIVLFIISFQIQREWVFRKK